MLDANLLGQKGWGGGEGMEKGKEVKEDRQKGREVIEEVKEKREGGGGL